jgi:hypothetical protein
MRLTRKGRYIVRTAQGGDEISQHNVEREAIEAAANSGLESAWIDYPEGMSVMGLVHVSPTKQIVLSSISAGWDQTLLTVLQEIRFGTCIKTAMEQCGLEH